MTFQDMYQSVQSFLGLQEISYFDELGMCKGFVNRGVVDVLSRTRCTVRCVDLRVLKDVGEYTVGDQLLGLVDIEDGLSRVNRSSGYSPSFTLIRSDILRVQPTPSEDGEIQVWGIKRPQAMVDDTSSPSEEAFGAIPADFHDAIVMFAMWKAADYADDSGSAQGERYRIQYEGQNGNGGRLAQIKMLVNKRGTARAPRRRTRLPVVQDASHWMG